MDDTALPPPDVEILPPAPDVAVTALTQDVGDGKWYAILDFTCVRGSSRREVIPRSTLNSPRKLLDQLTDWGCRLPPDQKGRSDLARSLAGAEPAKMLRLVRVTGWVDGVYVFPDTIVGDHQRLWIYRPRHPRPAAAEVGGSLEDWSRLVAARAVHSPYLVFGIAVAFASMLLEPLGVESGGFHLHGTSDPGKRSSIGKTLCLRVASSVFGSAARNSLGGWRGSDRGLEDLAATRNDQLLCLDEPRRSSADSREAEKRIRQIAFMIASERGRELAAGYTGGGGPVTWRLLMLSSGEEAIVELVTGGRLKGEEVRFIDLPIGVDPELGIFRRLPTKLSSSAQLVARLEKGCAQHFGHPARVFAERFVADRERWVRLARRRMRWFRRKVGVPDAGWERRFAERFALAYAAARSATDMGVLPWTQRQAFDAIALCYRAARGAIPDTEARVGEALARVREVLATGDRLVDLRRTAREAPSARALREAISLVRQHPARGTYYALKREEFEGLVAPLPAELALRRLQREGHLLTTSRRSLWRQVSVKGLEDGKQSFACILESFITMHAS